MKEFSESISVLSFNNSYAQFLASKGKTEEALVVIFQNLRVQSLILDSNLNLMQYVAVQKKIKSTLQVFIMLASKSNWDAEKIKKFSTVFVLESPEKTKQKLI